MDWSKVKNILIIVFIGLNVFLFSFVINIGEGKDVSESNLKDAEIALNKNGVELECKIPSYADQAEKAVKAEYSIDQSKVFNVLMDSNAKVDGNIEYNKEYKYDEKIIVFIDKNQFKYTNSKPDDDNINITSVSQADKYINPILKKMDLSLSGFKLDRSLVNEDGSITLIYVESYNKNISIFDSRILVNINSDGIKEIQCTLNKIEAKGEPTQTISAYQVLLRNFNVSGTVIKDIKFGYKAESSEQNANIYLPVWRIRLGDGSEHFFDAFTGDKIK